MKTLTTEDRRTLEELNAAVIASIKARREWLDSKMAEYAEVQVGEDLYNLNTGERLGKVAGFYRFWADRDNGVRDDIMDINYRYETAPNCYGNTSGFGSGRFGGKPEMEKEMQRRLDRLRGNKFDAGGFD